MAAAYQTRENPRPRKELSKTEQKVRRWILDHRGRLTQIALEGGVSHQYVQRIAYGKSITPSRDMRIERALRDHGCPGIRIR